MRGPFGKEGRGTTAAIDLLVAKVASDVRARRRGRASGSRIRAFRAANDEYGELGAVEPAIETALHIVGRGPIAGAVVSPLVGWRCRG
jgi:hypothetical protein